MQFLLRERSSEVIKLHDVEQSYNVEQSHDVELWHNAQFGAFIHRVGGKFPTKFLVWLCPRTFLYHTTTKKINIWGFITNSALF